MTLAAITTPQVDWLALSPVLAALAAATIALLGAVIVPRALERAFSVVVTFLGLAAAGVAAVVVYARTPNQVLEIAESMSRDRLAALAQILIAAVGAAVVLLSAGDRRRDHVGEHYSLVAVAVAGMLFFVQAGSLLTLFLGLEWFSIALYILCALDTHRRDSIEAGLKYLIVGSFGSAILLFGSALVYGATGELGFTAIRDATGADDPLFVAGLALLLAGLAFKASAAPFHMWTPDVYQGAPTAITALMGAATKVAALVVTLRVLVTAFPEQDELWTVALAVLAIVSLAVGNLAPLAQRDLKRLLAYSSISHAGFAFMAIAAASASGADALLYYLVPYAAATVGALAVIAARERETGAPVTFTSLEGLGWERPFHGIGLWVFVLGFAGFPLTGGFLGKLTVFVAVYEKGWWWLVVAGVVATAVSLGYYLAIIRALYMRTGKPAAEPRSARDLRLDAVVAVAVVVTIGSFFAVQPLVDLASKASRALPF